MTDNLYSPWRYKYLMSEKQEGCIFCIKPENDEERLVLYRSKHCFVIMNLYPYNNGHIMVVTNRHVSTMNELSKEEITDLFSTVQLSEKVLKDCYNTDGFNIGLNIGKAAGAGIADHLHVHVVPRWFGDSNFMTVAADVRVIPEDFQQAYTKLKESFNDNVREDR